MNALLVYPEVPDTFWSFRHALSFIGKKAAFPPLGLLTVAAMLPPKWEKRLVDVNVSRLTRKDLQWADIVFLGGMEVQKRPARQIITMCKEIGVKIVAGGPLFTIEHERFKNVDHFLLNEAELTLPLFLEDLEHSCAKRLYTTSEFADLHQSPAPMWELIDLEEYASMCVQWSRGCPFNCDFCNVTTLFGHQPRTKTPGQIINELDHLYDLGWREGIFFVDDNLVGNKRALIAELLPALIGWQEDKRGITFNTQVSINLADDEKLMQMMVKAGFHTVFIGIETPDEESLAECSKTQNKNRDLAQDVRRIQRAGLEVQGGFIVGFDHDTLSTFQRMTHLIQESGIVTAMVGLLQAPPGTKLYRSLKAAGRLLPDVSGDNVDGTTNVVPIMNPVALHAAYKRILETIYAPRNYHERIRILLRELTPPRVKIPLNFRYILNHVLAFARANYRLGILEETRVHYWKLLLWTLFHHPCNFALAIRLAVYGYHFRRVCELRVH